MKHKLLALAALASAAIAARSSSPTFSDHSLEGTIILEMNDSDQDAEIVIAFAGEPALERLRVWDPNGRQILNVRSRDQGQIGLGHIDLESGEPDIPSVLRAYPEGLYTFRGRTIDGINLHGDMVLTHELLGAPQLVFPQPGAMMVSPTDLTLQWVVDPDVEEYVLELESEEAALEIELLVKLPGDVGQFVVPNGLLQEAGEYSWQVRAVNDIGNVIATEATFFTVR